MTANEILRRCGGSPETDWYSLSISQEEYAPLLAELRSIYETGADPVRLVIAKRR